MPVRIYALAKELNLDSKELVQVCRKAGIPGKGSALASLDDDEVVKVKSYLSGGEKKSTKTGGSARGGAAATGDTGKPEAYTRDDYIAPGHVGKIQVLPTESRTASSKPAEAADAEPPKPDRPKKAPPLKRRVAAETSGEPKPKPPAEPGEDVSGQVPADAPPEVEAQTAATEGAPTEPSADAPTTPPSDAPVRPSLDAPVRMPGEIPSKPPTLTPNKPAAKTSGKAPVRKTRRPVIKLANMPEIKQPTRAAKKDEIKAQKPDIRLPKHAISGQKTPLDDVAKNQLEQESQKSKKPADGGKKRADKKSASMDRDIDAPLSGKGSKRRGSEGRSDRGLAGMASARADRQKTRKSRTRGRFARPDDRDARTTRRPRTLTRRRNVNTAAPRKDKVALEVPCTIREFSEASGVSSGQVLKSLMGMGVATLNINAQLDEELAETLAMELGVDVEFKQQASLEESLIDELESHEDEPESLQPRPPVITFLGHVDHGKTSLLDYIIGTNVVSGEAGGITQHIRAYEISKDGRKISFVDTPGHAAFTEMRARGANVTDIAVLVVAADDGVMPQTAEAISHAKAAGVPIIVALNKMDLPGANPDRVLQQLAAQDLLPSEWGGDVEVVRTSATTGDGVDELLETVLVTAEMHELTANPNRKAIGVCLESEQESGRGVVAKLIVQEGTLELGDIILCGSAFGRVKAMYETLRPKRRLKKAGPSTPVNVTGFDDAPGAGDKFYVLDDISQAREIAGQRADRSRAQSLAGLSTKVSFEEFQRRLSEGNLADTAEVVTLNLIIRTDVRGSIEAIEKELTKLDHPEVQIKVLHKAVGAITAADVMLAHASQAVIIGFNVIPDEAARALADEKEVEIRRYDVIYKVTDDIKAMLEGKLKPEERIVELGHALVKRVFPISRVGAVAGCYVVRGSIARGCRVRINREGRTIGDYELESLRHDKDDVKEVPRGMECGMKLSGFNDVKQDDILEAYTIEEVARTL